MAFDDIYNAKSLFLRLMRICVGLNNVTGVYLLSPGFLALNWSSGFRTFLLVSALLLIGWRIVQILRQRRKTTNTLSTIQAASQSTFINAQI